MICLEKVDKNACAEARDIYAEAFPRDEKLPFGYLLSENEGVDFRAAVEDGKTVGIFCVLYDETLAFLFYLAVRKDLRGSGYGSKILELIKQRHAERTIIVDVEELVDGCENYEQRERRQAFYRRAGFALTEQQLLEGPNLFSLMSTRPDVRLTEKQIHGVVKKLFGKTKSSLVDFYVKLYD